MITTVIFDLDQTLVDRDATFKLFLEKQHLRLKEHLGDITATEFYTIVKQYDNNGYTAKSEVYSHVCTDLDLGQDLTSILLTDFNEHYGHEPILFEDIHDVLSELQQQYTLALITNGRTKGQNAKIDKAQLRNYFKCIVVSETEGIKKPDIRIFERCLERLDVPAKNSVYIGDNPENDVRAAQLCGMKAIWRRNCNYQEIDYATAVVNTLSELPPVLKSI